MDTRADVALTGGYCWSFYFHVTRLLILRWLLKIFRPSTKARARHNFRRLGLTNSIRALTVHLRSRMSLTMQRGCGYWKSSASRQC